MAREFKNTFALAQLNMRIVFFALIAIVFVSCSSKVSAPNGGAASTGKYSEDLSSLRTSQLKIDSAKNAKGVTTNGTKTPEVKRDPAMYMEARHTVNESIDVVLDSIDRINLSYGLVDGFTIQLYSGTKREEALNVKKQLSTSLPQLDADVNFVQPNFRVRTGRYYNRFDAQKDYMAVKRYFPNAIIIPDRIPTTGEK
jgi:hypothetical protein